MRKTTKVFLWHLSAAGAGAAYLATWRWQLRWGATVAEQRGSLPGDDRVPQPCLQATRAIGIGAPPAVVWERLTKVARSTLQRADWPIGQRISDNSDKLAGHASQPTASDQVAEGETARLTKGLEVVVRLVEPGRALVASSDPAAEREGTPPFDVSWAFVLEPEGPSGTRLVMRARYAWTRWRAGLLAKALAWGGFVLSRSMLVNAKRHAEELWRQELAARSAESYSGSGLDAQTTSANLSVSAAQMTVAGSDTPSTGTDLSTKAAGRPKLKPTDPVS